jgi:flagellar assembly factor FliW
MYINSLRFGPLEIPDDKIIMMERPILGFENLTEFCLVEKDELAPFLWLQSVEESSVAFLIINPHVFFPEYRIEINPNEIAELRVATVESIETYVVVTVPEDPNQLSANLQGPILINTENNLAKQLVLVNSEYQVRHSILEACEELIPATRQREQPVGV